MKKPREIICDFKDLWTGGCTKGCCYKPECNQALKNLKSYYTQNYIHKDNLSVEKIEKIIIDGFPISIEITLSLALATELSKELSSEKE